MIQPNPCIKIVLTIALILISTSSLIQVPTTFGLITVTHARAGDNSQFMKYLKRYAYMQCPIINQISIIWNNEKSMEEMGVFDDRQNWKIPLYFYRTQYNSMYWRYNIPKQTKSEVFFFSIDDDIIIGCQELMKGFDVWRKNAIGNLAPIVTYGARFYEYTVQKGFEYGRKKEKDYFNTGLNIAFVSRHFLELYYADIWELNELKKHILKKNNCDDIALNWIIQYFYPELPTIVVQGEVENRSPAIAQSTTSSHYQFRNQCLKDFTDIFGINPLRYIRIKDKFPYRQKKLTPLVRAVVLAKQKYLNKYILKKQSLDNANQPYWPLALANQPVTITPMSKELQKFTFQLREQYVTKIQKLQQKQQQLIKQIQTNTKSTHQPELLAKLKQKFQFEQSLNKQLVETNYWRSYSELALGLLLVFLLWRFCELSREKQKKGRNFRLQSSQVQFQRQYLQS